MQWRIKCNQLRNFTSTLFILFNPRFYSKETLASASRQPREPATRRRTVLQLVAALRSCIEARDLEKGKLLHEEAAAASLHTNKYVAAALIKLYSRCRCIQQAQQVFDKLLQRDVVSWNSLVAAYAENGEYNAALDFLDSMDCEPSCVTYLAALKAIAGLASEKKMQKRAALEKTIEVHRQISGRRGFESDVLLMTTLLDVYCKCGDMKLAREVFDGMSNKTVVTWNCLLLGYVENGSSRLALELFHEMSCKPDPVTFVAALKACGSLAGENKSEMLETGIAIHRRAEGSFGLNTNLVLATTLLDMYTKCGSMELARGVFEKMKHRSVVTWSSLILGYVENGLSGVALELFEEMDCEPNPVTFIAVLKACGSLALENEPSRSLFLKKGIEIHQRIKARGFESELIVATTLIDMYSKCGDMSSAREVFEKMVPRDVVSWNTLMLGYVQNGESSVAIDLFSGMDCVPDSKSFAAALKACGTLASDRVSEKARCLEKGICIHRRISELGLESDLVLSTNLMEMYSRCGSIQGARDLFDKMIRRDVVTWTCLINGYCENGQSSSALELFSRMDCDADSMTYVAALRASGSSTDLSTGREIHSRLCRLGLEQLQVVGNSLIDFYSKCGCMIRAEELFNSMRMPDLVSWNSLIGGYSSLGDSGQVLGLVNRMQEAGVQMDGVTLLCVLSACSHVGLVEKGKLCFESMISGSSRVPGVSMSVEHYNCMVDMMGRANRLEEALAIARSMPFKPDSVLWMSLLGACRKWSNPELGKVAFEELILSGEKTSAACALMRELEHLPRARSKMLFPGEHQTDAASGHLR